MVCTSSFLSNIAKNIYPYTAVMNNNGSQNPIFLEEEENMLKADFVGGQTSHSLKVQLLLFSNWNNKSDFLNCTISFTFKRFF